MKKRLNEITALFKKMNFDDLNGATDDKKLLYLYGLYHYFWADPDCILDLLDHCKYTGKYGNLIQACFEPDAYEERIVDVISLYCIDDNESFEVKKMLNIFSQIQAIVSQLKNGIYTAVGNESILKDYIDSKSTETIVIKILSNYAPEYDEKMDILDIVDKLTPIYNFIKFEIVFADDIEDEIAQMSSDKKLVEQGTVELYDENNFLKYGNEESIICNVSALSLKNTYSKYGKGGLFASNLRFYITNKRVDECLENSIKNKGENFWYYNNGIIIVCDDYSIDGKQINLKNFSIVNGGQTTRMLGVVPFANDFAVMCKIIKNKYPEDKEAYIKFLSEVAEASNTQKPINSADIIANKAEQRLLKENLGNEKIFVQIKRGEAAMANLKENYPEPWQKTKNDEIGQLVYGGIYQKPGTARNSKDKIFSDPKKYELVFGNYNIKKYSNELLKDLLIIRTYYKKWATAIAKSDDEDVTKKGLVKNSMLFFEASIVLMAKLYYSKDLCETLKEIGVATEKGIYILSQRTFNHRIFCDEYSQLEKRMYELFNLVYDKYISRVFLKLKEIKPDLAYSNFTKIDKNYTNWIMPDIYDDFAYEISSRVSGTISKIFYEENSSDKADTSELVKNAIESFDKRPTEEDEEDILGDELVDKLKEFRTNKYKEKGIKAYEVFNNQELKQLALLKPRSTKELLDFGCFKVRPRTKTRLYGREIIDIIISVCGEKNK